MPCRAIHARARRIDPFPRSSTVRCVRDGEQQRRPTRHRVRGGSNLPEWIPTYTMTGEVRQWLQNADDAEQCAVVGHLYNWACDAIEVSALTRVQKRNPTITPGLIENAICSRKKKMLERVQCIPFMGVDPPDIRLLVYGRRVTVCLTTGRVFDTVSAKAAQHPTLSYVPAIRSVAPGLVSYVCKHMARSIGALDIDNSSSGHVKDSGYETDDEFAYEYGPMTRQEFNECTGGIVGTLILVMALLCGASWLWKLCFA